MRSCTIEVTARPEVENYFSEKKERTQGHERERSSINNVILIGEVQKVPPTETTTSLTSALISNTVLTSLRSLLEVPYSKRTITLSKQQLKKNAEKIELYLKENISSMVLETEKRPEVITSFPKSKTGLPYTIRCRVDQLTKKAIFYVSEGKWKFGGEKTVKTALVVTENCVRRIVQSGVKKTTSTGERLPDELLTHLFNKLKNEAAIATTLIRKGVPNLLRYNYAMCLDKKGNARPKIFAELCEQNLLEFITTPCDDAKEQMQKYLNIAHHLSLTLEKMHACNVGHFDLKPSNILLTATKRVLLTDFGFARELNTTIHAKGSNGYIAPEMVEPKSIQASSAADMWSLGAILYVLCFKKNPFQEVQKKIMAQTDQRLKRIAIDELKIIIQEQREFLNQPQDPTRPELGPHPLYAIIASLLSTRPDERMTAAGVRNFFDDALASSAGKVAPSSVPLNDLKR